MREKGIIVRYLPERGFGFIQINGGQDLFLHCTELRPGVSQSEIQVGRRVKFEISLKYGKPRAIDVELV